jgi:predicted glycoside hydrolase/deacetylase ChbG (UPF0249 family)
MIKLTNKAGIILLGFFLLSTMSFSQDPVKKLILHCDDLVVSHSVNQAAIDLYEAGVINSAAIMVPTPWFTEIAKYGVANPEFDLGLHLTLTSEWENYKWGPVSGRDKVPSLVDENGYLYTTSEAAVENAKPKEVEIEIRAQIEMAIATGLKPTHLDSHMGVLFSSPELFEVYVKLGKEYKIPVFVPKEQVMAGYPEMAKNIETDGLLIDRYWGILPNVEAKDWTKTYVDYVENMTEGVSLIIIHLGYDTYELEHTMGKNIDFGSAWRQRDVQAMMDQKFQDAIKTNEIVMTNYRELYFKK